MYIYFSFFFGNATIEFWWTCVNNFTVNRRQLRKFDRDEFRRPNFTLHEPHYWLQRCVSSEHPKPV